MMAWETELKLLVKQFESKMRQLAQGLLADGARQLLSGLESACAMVATAGSSNAEPSSKHKQPRKGKRRGKKQSARAPRSEKPKQTAKPGHKKYKKTPRASRSGDRYLKPEHATNQDSTHPGTDQSSQETAGPAHRKRARRSRHRQLAGDHAAETTASPETDQEPQASGDLRVLPERMPASDQREEQRQVGEEMRLQDTGQPGSPDDRPKRGSASRLGIIRKLQLKRDVEQAEHEKSSIISVGALGDPEDAPTSMEDSACLDPGSLLDSST